MGATPAASGTLAERTLARVSAAQAPVRPSKTIGDATVTDVPKSDATMSGTVSESGAGSNAASELRAALAKDEGLAHVNEYRAGTYIYADRMQVAAGSAGYDDCALTVLSTVVSTPTMDRAMIDAGSKSLTLANRNLSVLRTRR